jgi:rhodanese-related sulfurtransferase
MKLKSCRVALLLMAAALLSWQSAYGQQLAADAKAEPADAEVERITVDELKSKLAKNESLIIIDVRGSDYDASDSRIKGAMRIAPAELKAHLGDIPRDREIVTYCACATDGGAMKAAKLLKENGFKQVRALRGGWNAWRESGGAVEPKQD